MKVLILCTGNSCRSQMTEGILRTFHPTWEIFSAGTHPEKEVNPYAIQVMQEIGLDISSHYPKHSDQFTKEAFDVVMTVCDNARENCPVFNGEVKKRLHIGFEDPAAFTGTDDEILTVYRMIRDQIRDTLSDKRTFIYSRD
ncbi:MAG: arsenate reductase ArsC [Bacteroidia bacterium]|nr:arsenate reductase ArsC [Bacteroidia bacterium]